MLPGQRLSEESLGSQGASPRTRVGEEGEDSQERRHAKAGEWKVKRHPKQTYFIINLGFISVSMMYFLLNY